MGLPCKFSERRHIIHHCLKHFIVMNIGGSDTDSKRNTISIGYNMILASKMVSIYGGVSWHSFWPNHSVVNTYSRTGSLLCVVQFLQNGVVNI